jgi:subtilisin family serine protease
MSLRFLGGAQGSGTAADAISAIEYATANGAKLTSNSWGGGPYSQALFDVISDANDKGILFVAAAGNSKNDNDKSPSYPASYKLPNIIAVAASDANDELASFSNFGAKSVMLAAPGVNILSTIPNREYKRFSGTSMACPHVSGAAALLFAAYPSLSPTQVKDLLLSSVDTIAGLEGRVSTGGRMNLAKAFERARAQFGAPN